MKIISRADAIAAGLARYFTGKPCKREHSCERYVHDYKCVECHADDMANFHAARRPERLEKMRGVSRSHFQTNKTVLSERHRNWHRAHPEYNQAKLALRRARKLRAVPPWFSEIDDFVWAEAVHLGRLRGEATGIEWHADHAIPLSAAVASGLHVASNCQVIPARINTKKSNNMVFTEPFSWIEAL